MKRFIAFIFCFWACYEGLLNAHPNEQQGAPIAVWLTWQNDPSSTMTVQWLTYTSQKSSTLLWRNKEDHSGWLSHEGVLLNMPYNGRYLIHRAEIKNLEASTEYSFKIPSNAKEYFFRTMPSRLEQQGIRFVEGGDTFKVEPAKLSLMNRLAAQTDPDFALIGGDIAYAASSHSWGVDDVERWVIWLRIWSETMVTGEGRTIPLLVTLGNHDVNGGFAMTPSHAWVFHMLFASPGPRGYNVIDFGNYMSLFLLDSGHTNPVNGVQSSWLQQALAQRQNQSFILAAYHVPAFPSARPFKNNDSEAIRRSWIPIFEQSFMDMAFEHHDHTYKRTHPIRQGQRNRDGVIYIGDGAWGVKKPRTPRNEPYLAKALASSNMIVVDIDTDRLTCYALDDSGQQIDNFFLEPRRALAPLPLSLRDKKIHRYLTGSDPF